LALKNHQRIVVMLSEKTYCTLLKVLALLCLVPVLLHAFGGIASENLLQAGLPPAALNNASLDSQNRFYGVMFALFPACLWLASTDLKRYEKLLSVALVIFFLAGASRLVSWWSLGAPSLPIQWLAAIELAGPLLLWWLRPRS
jgi:hypothetical protein